MRRLVQKCLLPVMLSGFAGLCSVVGIQAEETHAINTHCTDSQNWLRSMRNAPPVEDCSSCYLQTSPLIYFNADALLWTRGGADQSGAIIGGPDALNYDDVGFNFEGGYRIKAAVATQNFEFELAWMGIDGWSETQAGQLNNGIAFDSSIGGTFAGANFINGTTAFASLFAAAEFNPVGGPNEINEDEGFGPVGVLADAAPTYNITYQSDLQDFELMTKYLSFHPRLKFGVGYRHVDLDELSAASITGTFRAVDNAVGANGGLSNAALTNPNGGNLVLQAGTADGFDDETALLGGAGPDILRLDDRATTRNSLDGVQFSLDALLLQSERFLLDTVLKVGAYNNSARGTIAETYTGIGNDNSVYGRAQTANANSVAFVGQVGVGVTYRVNHRLRLRGGWDVLFLSGVALSPEQRAAGVATNYQLNTDGDVVANGGSLGLELVY